MRNSVIDALDQAIYACQQIAKGGSGISFKVALNLLSAVMGLITSSSSASAAGAAASLTSAYISLKESDDVKITDSEGEKEVSTANDVLSHFESVLSKINEKMKNAEDSVSRQLENEWNDIHDNKQSNYIIELTPIDNICQEVIVNRHDVDNITNVYLPNISSILDKAALKAGDLSMSTVVYRAGDAGKYYRGPNGWYENMQQLIRSLLRNLAWQTSEAAYNLHAAADLYDDTDADASNRLKRTTENINNGSGVDFWRRPN